jgi:ABC-2 type transport system permease protein
MSVFVIELAKLRALRSVWLAAGVLFVLPWIWSFAPDLPKVYGLALVSAYQMPTLSLLTVMQFVLPLLVSVSVAELIGAEVTARTLATAVLRPVTRSQILAAKLAVALIYPLLLLAILLVSSLLAGARFGLGAFYGGSGLGAGGFAGLGLTSPALALGQILRAYLLAWCSLLPVAALALLCAVWSLQTALATLATIVALAAMRLLVVFPGIRPLLLTSHLDLYQAAPSTVGSSAVLLAIYLVLFVAGCFYLFDRRDL